MKVKEVLSSSAMWNGCFIVEKDGVYSDAKEITRRAAELIAAHEIKGILIVRWCQRWRGIKHYILTKQ